MERTFRNIVWIILGLTPFVFWFQIYRASTTEYDDNWAHFFLAVFISFLTIGLLIINRKDFDTSSKQKKFIRAFSFLFASPLTIGLIVLYQMTIPMQWKWSSSHVNDGKSYSDIKKRNYFKAENYLILDDLTTNSDTIKAVVTRNGEIEKISRLKDGHEMELSNSILDSLSDKQRKSLTEY